MIRHLTSKESAHSYATPVALKSKIVKITGKKFQHPDISLILVTAGKLQLDVNGYPYLLQSGDLLHIPEGSNGEVFPGDSPVEVLNVTFSKQYLEQNLIESPHGAYYRDVYGNRNVMQQLDMFQRKRIGHLFRMLRHGGLSDNVAFRLQVQKLHFNLLICEVAGIQSRVETDTLVIEKNTVLSRFMDLLNRHVRKEHKVAFYARALCMSADHLTKVVKKGNHRTTKQCIEQALIVEAKMLLSRFELSILYITEELEFSNISTFSNFFKKHTLLTPTAYRLSVQSGAAVSI